MPRNAARSGGIGTGAFHPRTGSSQTIPDPSTKFANAHAGGVCVPIPRKAPRGCRGMEREEASFLVLSLPLPLIPIIFRPHPLQ